MINVEYYIGILEELDNIEKTLSNKECDFIENMLEQYEYYGSSMRISEKQAAWIDVLKERYLL